MKDKDLLKLKFGLGAVSLVLLLGGSTLLVDQWKSVNWAFWFLIGWLAYFGVYRTIRHLYSKNTQIIFNGFETAGTITFSIVIALTTVMLLIFYPVISFLILGLALLILVAFVGLRFITFDFDGNKIGGLFADRQLSIASMTVDIHPDNNEIEIRTKDRDDILVLKREKFSSGVWIQLIDNFQRIKIRR